MLRSVAAIASFALLVACAWNGAPYAAVQAHRTDEMRADIDGLNRVASLLDEVSTNYLAAADRAAEAGTADAMSRLAWCRAQQRAELQARITALGGAPGAGERASCPNAAASTRMIARAPVDSDAGVEIARRGESCVINEINATLAEYIAPETSELLRDIRSAVTSDARHWRS